MRLPKNMKDKINMLREPKNNKERNLSKDKMRSKLKN